MGKASCKYLELRFLIEEELTQVFVYCQAIGDCPIGVQGWHHKTFPPTKPVNKILKVMFSSADNCMLWPLNSPKGK